MLKIDKEQLKFDGVLWDMDGTIADSEPIHERAIRHTLNKYGVDPTHDDMQSVLGTEGSKTFEYFQTTYDLTVSFEDYQASNYQYFCAHSNEVTPLYGCEVFKSLRALGVPQAIVTNSDRILVNASLAALQLEIPGLAVVARNDVVSGFLRRSRQFSSHVPSGFFEPHAVASNRPFESTGWCNRKARRSHANGRLQTTQIWDRPNPLQDLLHWADFLLVTALDHPVLTLSFLPRSTL